MVYHQFICSILSTASYPGANIFLIYYFWYQMYWFVCQCFIVFYECGGYLAEIAYWYRWKSLVFGIILPCDADKLSSWWIFLFIWCNILSSRLIVLIFMFGSICWFLLWMVWGKGIYWSRWDYVFQYDTRKIYI